MNKGLMTSNTCEWETPQKLFDSLKEEFGGFDVDVCATEYNTKCDWFFSKHTDGLKQNWSNLRCWMNPPYGREVGKWVEKALRGGAKIVVGLLPARTDTRWFHDFIYGKAEIRFLKGRVHFNNSGPAPFPSMVVIWRE